MRWFFSLLLLTVSAVMPLEYALSAETSELADRDDVTFADLSGLVFNFTSGAGAWSTEVRIHHDGTFRGEFHDSDAGVTDTDYPDGTRYSCSFYGKFSPLRKVGPHTYAMNCEWLAQEGTEGEERIVDGVKEITAGPYGFDNAGEFFLYLPGKKVDDLPGPFVDWMALPRGSEFRDRDALDFYGLYNVGGEQGFDSNAEDPPAGVDKRFVGSWHDGTEAAEGFGERYVLYGDGTFVYAASETGVASRELFKTGTWSIADGELRLAIKERFILPVGPIGQIQFDEELVNVDGEIIKRICNPPDTETHEFVRIRMDVETRKRAAKIDGATFYDFSDRADLMDGYHNLLKGSATDK